MNANDDSLPRTVHDLYRLYPNGKKGGGRSAMLQAFEESDWEICVVLAFPNGGVWICSGGKIICEFNRDELRRAMSPKHYAIVETLLTLLDRQSTAATVAGVVAGAELALHKKKVKGGPRGGKASAKPARAKVIQLMQAQLRQGRDPHDHFAVWAEEYGYSKRHMPNILKAAKAKETR